MLRLIVTVIVTLIVILFSMENSDKIIVNLFGAEPIEIRLIFVIFISMAAGAMIPIFYGMVRKIKKAQKAKEPNETHMDDDDELFEEDH